MVIKNIVKMKINREMWIPRVKRNEIINPKRQWHGIHGLCWLPMSKGIKN